MKEIMNERNFGVLDGTEETDCSYNSHVTGGVENAVLSTRRYFSKLIVSLKTQVQRSFLRVQHTKHQLSLDGLTNCVTVLARGIDTLVS